MTPCWTQTIALLSALLLAKGACGGRTSVFPNTSKHLRVARDTRNIPIDKFQSINATMQAVDEDPLDATAAGGTDEEFAVASTAEARRIGGPSDESSSASQSFFKETKYSGNNNENRQNIPDSDPRFNQPFGYQPGLRPVPRPYPIPSSMQPPYTGFRPNFGPSTIHTGFRNSPIPFPVPGSMSHSSRGFPISSGPNDDDMIPLMSRGMNTFPYPVGSSFVSRQSSMPTPFGFDGDSSGGSSGNFFRSQSYSITSDGMGAPRVEHNVFDSRDGFGMQSRNF
ncbi:uncharacterized protein LOC115629086 [Scaptodrosophila lebanonensis]|uniref:Uncharacterized protein LOC115629001 n=1 Tax=Drosophila lebanonensis TaxID=7225 RepID=A0A6J2U025_DROLE|nr:uncharacterized protein LOC115629001 [Scaptodrosophila lebanonensis]XP_030381260.1 uncharacterized protein LOC115629086 [Scaptodrosophila lebanonensis]